MLDRRGLHERITGSTAPPTPAPAYAFAAMGLDLAVLKDSNPLYLLPVPQARLAQVLAERAAELGVQVRRGHELAELTQDDDGVTVSVAGPEGGYQLRARYLAGADGAHSVARTRCGIAFPGVTKDNRVERTANASAPEGWVDPGTGTLNVPGYGPVPVLRHHRTETGTFVYAGFPGRPPLVSTIEYDVPEDTGTPLSMAEMEESIRRVLGVSVPLTPPAGQGPHLLRRRIGTRTRLAERYRDRRVLLVGDAAHVHTVTGGAGLNLGLQDAVNLGWKLAAAIHDGAWDGLLDTYEAERRPVARRVIMQTQAQSALTAPGPDVTALRELFGELLTDPGNIQHIADTMAGGDVRYEAGDHPLTGRFAPDLELRTASGPTRLARLTRDARPLLLDMTETGLPSDGRWRLVRAQPPAPDVTALLLRPDTYVAWACSRPRPGGEEIDALRMAAGRWLG
jgi:2-polyprenyl-6-methoxyphenol hydroxylase-like FAD-dependent oxidoreductase